MKNMLQRFSCIFYLFKPSWIKQGCSKIERSSKICWQSAILLHGGIHISLYAEKLSLKLMLTLTGILRKENIYGAYPCIISTCPLIFIIPTELCMLMEMFQLIERQIKRHLT